MSTSTSQLLEDRALRDAARGLVRNDIAFIRESVSARSVPARVADRISGGARDIADEAAVVADENRAVLGGALFVGAVGLTAWVFRSQLEQGLDDLLGRMKWRVK